MRESSQTTRPPERGLTHGSRLLLGDWSKLVRDPIDLIRLSFLVGAVIALGLGEWTTALRMALTFGLTMLARALDLPRPFDLAFNLGMVFQAWGNFLNLFVDIYAYDKIVHFVLPASVAALLYLLAVRFEVLPDLEQETGLHQRVGILVVTFCLGVTVGAIYEVYEYVFDTALGGHLAVSYGDTIGDLADDAAGALAGGVLIVVWDTYGWGTRRRARGIR